MVLHWTKQRKIAWRSEAFSEHQTPHLLLEFEKMQERKTDFGIAWTNKGRLFDVGGQTGLNKPTQSVEMLRCCSIDAEPTANGTTGLIMSRYFVKKQLLPVALQNMELNISPYRRGRLRTTDLNISSQPLNIIAVLTWGTWTCATFGISAYKNIWNKQKYCYHLLCACFSF